MYTVTDRTLIVQLEAQPLHVIDGFFAASLPNSISKKVVKLEKEVSFSPRKLKSDLSSTSILSLPSLFQTFKNIIDLYVIKIYLILIVFLQIFISY